MNSREMLLRIGNIKVFHTGLAWLLEATTRVTPMPTFHMDPGRRWINYACVSLFKLKPLQHKVHMQYVKVKITVNLVPLVRG